jgi:[amino group carrier protein]-lysine/ornithine hydrolase
MNVPDVLQPGSRDVAVELLQELVKIPSLSRHEAAATHWLAAQMARLGYERAYVDAAGNAVGEMGAADAERIVILLGHIDTVPGNIPVEIVAAPDGELLYGRGTVDAKGPLATFVMAGARLGAKWAADAGVQLVVVGAVEEEAATSKGARFIRQRFDGDQAALPIACVIGEPSSWQRVTLGYKGRLLVNLAASQPMAHTAGPDTGVATVAVDIWNWVMNYASRYNYELSKSFERLMPSFRQIHTHTDEAMHEWVHAQIGIRLPLDFDVDGFASELVAYAGERVGTSELPALAHVEFPGQELDLVGEQIRLTLALHGYEQAWRSERDTPLVRSFLAAIRSQQVGIRPSFVVKTGTSDMNVVAPVWRCPILAYGPGDSTLDHTPHEHLALDEYWLAIQVLENALQILVRAEE